MTTVVVEESPNSSLETPETAEVIEELEQTVEPIADASVEIAQINADAQVEIANTEAAVELARIDAQTELVESEWRERLTSMEAENLNLREQVSTLQMELSALQTAVVETNSELLPSEELEIVEAETLTPPSTLAETSETQTGPIVVSDSERELEASVPLVSVRKPIFRLV